MLDLFWLYFFLLAVWNCLETLTIPEGLKNVFFVKRLANAFESQLLVVKTIGKCVFFVVGIGLFSIMS